MNKLVKISLMLMACGVVFVSAGILMGGTLAFSYSFGGKVQTEPAKECKMLTEEVNPFTNIRLDVDDFSIKVATGDGYAVTYPEGNSDMDTAAFVEGETLTLTQKYKKQLHFFCFDTLDIGLFGKSASNTENAAEKQQIVVTVPEGTALKTIQVKQSMGDLTLEDLQAEDIGLDMDYGSLTVLDVTAEAFNLKNDYGDIAFRNVTGTRAEIKIGYGSFQADTVQFESLRADLDSGNAKLYRYTGNQVSMEMDYGDLEAEAVNASVFKADLNYGDADLVFSGGADSYAMDLSCDDGKILVDGQKQGSEYHNKGNADGKTISIDADYGNISIDFAR